MVSTTYPNWVSMRVERALKMLEEKGKLTDDVKDILKNVIEKSDEEHREGGKLNWSDDERIRLQGLLIENESDDSEHMLEDAMTVLADSIITRIAGVKLVVNDVDMRLDGEVVYFNAFGHSYMLQINSEWVALSGIARCPEPFMRAYFNDKKLSCRYPKPYSVEDVDGERILQYNIVDDNIGILMKLAVDLNKCLVRQVEICGVFRINPDDVSPKSE